MKKLSLALTIASIISGVSFADTNTVASANVLGYTKVIDPASNKYVLIAAPFNCGTGTVSTLRDVFGTNQLRQGTLVTRCDQVITWNVAAQQYVAYAQKTNGLFYLTSAFTGSPTNPTVTRGQALWILSPTAAYAPSNRTVIISGNVPTDGSYTNSIVGNPASPLNFAANPYPVEMDLYALINTNDGANGNAISTKADKVLVWNESTQQYVNYALKVSANTNVNNKWLLASSFTATTPPVVKIKPGQGFWYQTTNSFTWVESKSYTLE